MEHEKTSKGRTLIKLFFTMMKLGAFTFGGGYAMISLLQNEFVNRKKWIEADEFLDIVAIAESTPGPIAVNSSTYIGYRVAGVLGSLLGTFGMVLPSLTIIFLISLVFDTFLKWTVVQNAFRGIQACVVYLILSAGFKLLKNVKKDIFSLIILGLTMAFVLIFSIFSVKFSSIFYILISAAAGLVFCLLRREKKEDAK
ncbi:MAG: chromate transporter [Clostridia bacterium]|nr:chromate transporter [Clostridia bacterium]